MARALEFVRKYKLLLVIYVLGVVFGIREYLVRRDQGTVDWLSDRWADMTDVVAAVNPDDPDTEFLEAMRSLARGDQDEYIRRFEAALDEDVKHNEFLLHDYAQFMLNRGRDWRGINAAVNRWRENFPFSAETLELHLGVGPRGAADQADLMREIGAVEWIGDARLEPYSQDGQERWRVVFTFRPPLEVDIRDAVAAVSVLSIPEGDRTRLKVTCATLQDCRVGPR